MEDIIDLVYIGKLRLPFIKLALFDEDGDEEHQDKEEIQIGNKTYKARRLFFNYYFIW